MARDERRVGERHAALGPTVVRLCEAVACQDVLAIVTSETRGEAIARAAAVLTDALVLWCPSPDSLPGEDAPASLAIAGLRVAALSALHNRGGRRVLLVTDASAAARTVAPPEAFEASPLILAVGDAIDREALAGQLEAIGFERDDRVDEPGEFADRAATIDIYPADAAGPLRIHLDEGRIDEIVRYDSLSQLRTGETLDRIAICPAVEPQGRSNSSLFDHLAGAAVALDPEAEERRDRVVELAREAGGKAGLVSDWTPHLAGRERISLAAGDEQPSPRFVEARNPERAFRKAFDEARAAGKRVLIAGSARDIRFVSRRIEQRSDAAPQPIALWSEVRAARRRCPTTTPNWTRLADDGLLVVATSDILARAPPTRALRLSIRSAAKSPISLGDASSMRISGSACCAGSSGRGRRGGKRRVRSICAKRSASSRRGGGPAVALRRRCRRGHARQARRLLLGETPRRDRPHGCRDRASAGRPGGRTGDRTAAVLSPPVSDYERFAATFPFTETPDQARAIEAVRADLASGKPMDRLVVGDVGYGKTEVALRAVAVAALSGKQVALVAPTTVLVRQHIESFRKRFERFGIAVAGLSRLSTPAEMRAAKKGLADGSVRVVIGTKAVAGKGVEFQDLGLVVIDEEQRFGTADKARLRTLAEGVHVLTLTATPIPAHAAGRAGRLQELSLITTPPARRLPTRTRVAGFSAELVRPALLREKRRGGQSFVVVPRIEDMAPMAERLTRLVPDLKLRQAHGKMPAAEIDEEMIAFSAGDGDILLATNIIEAGLDIRAPTPC
jgi:transcription-repair coupling factor (superfamily II helicase)